MSASKSLHWTLIHHLDFKRRNCARCHLPLKDWQHGVACAAAGSAPVQPDGKPSRTWHQFDVRNNVLECTRCGIHLYKTEREDVCLYRPKEAGLFDDQ